MGQSNVEKIGRRLAISKVLRGFSGSLTTMAIIPSLQFLSACSDKKKPKDLKAIPVQDKVKIHTTSYKLGHKARGDSFPTPKSKIEIDTLVIGGGVSGLSAGWYFKSKGYDNFAIIELEAVEGGNSRSGKNQNSMFPLGAHYLPIPNLNYSDLINFLDCAGVITGYSSEGIPIYNDYYLCFEPFERLYKSGAWQDGLIPKNYNNNTVSIEFEKFFQIMEEFKSAIGNDKKNAFTIPIEFCSQDPRYRELDNTSFKQYLISNNFQTEELFWYVDYCCNDDFGAFSDKISAWAGIHYFSSRTGKAINANSSQVLTWPEGNNFLVKQLSKNISDHIKTNSLVFKMTHENGKWHCLVYDSVLNQSIEYIANQCIVATPQFVNKHIIKDYSKTYGNPDWEFNPWFVANLSIRNASILSKKSELSWDNVIYGSSNLGYVNALQQSVKRFNDKAQITYYQPVHHLTSNESRRFLLERNPAWFWTEIIENLSVAHPEIASEIEEVDVFIHGHGMIGPKVGFLSDEVRNNLKQSTNGLSFVHTDVSGISIFEEAFFRGVEAAKKIVNSNQS